MIEHVLPRHLEIIYLINHFHLEVGLIFFVHAFLVLKCLPFSRGLDVWPDMGIWEKCLKIVIALVFNTRALANNHGTTRPPLRGGKAPPCFSKAPPLIYKGGAEGPPPLYFHYSMIFQIFQVLSEKIFPTSSF